MPNSSALTAKHQTLAKLGGIIAFVLAIALPLWLYLHPWQANLMFVHLYERLGIDLALTRANFQQALTVYLLATIPLLCTALVLVQMGRLLLHWSKQAVFSPRSTSMIRTLAWLMLAVFALRILVRPFMILRLKLRKRMKPSFEQENP